MVAQGSGSWSLLGIILSGDTRTGPDRVGTRGAGSVMSMRSEIESERFFSTAASRELDLGGLGRSLKARKWWIIVSTLLCCLAAIMFVTLVEPHYTGEAKVLVENGDNYFTRPDRTEQQSLTLPDDEAVQSQVQLISSRDIARQAIRRLDLKGNPEFDPVARGISALTRLMVILGLERDPTTASPEERILTSYYDKLTVYPVPKSRVIAIEFTASDPDLAARGANTVAELFIEAQSAAKREAARSAAASLASLVTDLRARVSDAEAKADEYRTQSGLLIGTNNATLSTQQLGDMTTQLAQARTAEADAQAKAKLIKDMIRQNRVGEIPDVANNEFIRRINEQRGNLKAEIALQARTLLPGHPHMQELTAQLADFDVQLRSALDKQARTMENDAHIAAGRVENLMTALDAQKKTAGTAGIDQVHLNTLETQARLLKEQLEFNTSKYQEAMAREAAASTPADARVISRASTPQLPSFPKKLPIIAIGTLAGLMLSLGTIIGGELLSGRAFPVGENEAETLPRQIRDPRTAAAGSDVVDAPVAVDTFAEAESRPAGDAGLRDALNALRDLHVPGRAARVLIVPSATQSEASVAALAFARRLSMEGRAILVDANSARPIVDRRSMAPSSLADEENEPSGLSELLAGSASFAEIIHRDALSRLHVVPVGGQALDRESTGALTLVFNALGETYDFLAVFAPALPDSLTLRLAAEIDMIVLSDESESQADDRDLAYSALERDADARGVELPPIYVVPISAYANDRLIGREAA